MVIAFLVLAGFALAAAAALAWSCFFDPDEASPDVTQTELLFRPAYVRPMRRRVGR